MSIKIYVKQHKGLVAVALFIMVLVIIHKIEPFVFIKLFFYVKNGQTIELDHYKITLPFPEWIYYGKSKFMYVVSSNDMTAEIAIDYRDVELDFLLNQCASVEQTNKTYNEVSGQEYLCSIDNTITMFFLSNDNYIFIRTEPYLQDDKNSRLYELLFNSIRKNQ